MIEVAFPTDVITPVRFAFVVTEPAEVAVVAVVAFPDKAPVNVVVVRLFVEGLKLSPVPRLCG